MVQLKPTSRMSGLEYGCFAAFILVFVGVVWLNSMLASLPTLEQQQAKFQAELAEQNRQADVASQLRAAEAGDLASVQGGRFWAVLWNNLGQGGEITFADCPGPRSGTHLYRMDDASKRVSSVIKYSPGSAEYAEAANIYIRCERTK